MKKVLSLLGILLFPLFLSAQLTGVGYYRVQNYATKYYMYVTDNTGSINLQATDAEMGALQLYKGLDLAITNPASVIYFNSVTAGASSKESICNFSAQGVDVYGLVQHLVTVYATSDGHYQVYASKGGLVKYLDDENVNNKIPTSLGKYHSVGTTKTGSLRNWDIIPINNATDNYVAIKPTMTISNKHYAPYYAAYPFSLSEGMKAYVVTKVDARQKMAVYSELPKGQIIPASTPVLIECASDDVSKNKITLYEPSKGTKPSVNLLKGVYFCNDFREEYSKEAHTLYDSNTMRVFGVTSEGKMGFINSTKTLHIDDYVAAGWDDPNGKYYLNANQSYLPVSSGTPDQLTLVTEEEYQKFLKYQITVSAEVNGKVSVTPLNQDNMYQVGTELTLTATPNEGYEFVSWSNGSKDNPMKVTVGSVSASYKASFKPKNYTLSFVVDGQTTSTTVPFGGAIKSPSTPSKAGYTFAGWDKVVPTTMPASNLTFTATWKVNQYKVTFLSDGKVLSEGMVDYSGKIKIPSSPSKEGYTFTGWDKDIPTAMPAGNLTFTATWKINQYKVTFLSDGKVLSEDMVDYSGKITTPSSPSKEGYTFTGWDKDVPTAMPAGSLTFTATWKINQYKVTFVSDGETLSEATIDFADNISVPTSPSKEGYTFIGWDKDVPSGMPASDLTFNAVWKVNQYKVTFISDGEVLYEIDVDYAGKIVLPSYPTKEGYVFDGWNEEIPTSMPACDLSFTAQWKVYQYKITFMSEDQVYMELGLDYAEGITLPSIPTRDGYTFVGWDKELPSTMPANDLVFTAQWKVNQYKVTFLADAQVVSETIQDYASVIVVPDSPEKEGYTFVGWDKELPSTMPASDLVFVATWKINQYKVIFIVDDQVVSEDVLDYASAIVAPSSPKKEGYTFMEWSPELSADVPSHDLVYEAVFKVNTYKVSFYYGETLLKEFDVAYGDALPEYIWTPEQDNIIFNGWGGESYETMPACDLVYHADFTDAVRSVNAAPKSVRIYSLNGNLVKVASNIRDANLPAGIYVIDGRKIVIR